jgi:molecular chaperone DnaK (HSP70)
LSVVHIDPETGDALTGESAFEQTFLDPANAARQFKLKLGTDDEVLPGKTATDLVAILLAEEKRLIESQTGEAVDGAVLTVPANFTDLQKTAVNQAAETAGYRCATARQ